MCPTNLKLVSAVISTVSHISAIHIIIIKIIDRHLKHFSPALYAIIFFNFSISLISFSTAYNYVSSMPRVD